MSAVSAPRARPATVDPLILAQALAHIERTALASRSQTRRLRWIANRAACALEGRQYSDAQIDLPKSAGPDTPEKLQKRLAFELGVRHELVEALQPFANFACSPAGACDCHNCRARDVILKVAAIRPLEGGAS